MPPDSERLLHTRSLTADHKYLARELRPGMSVLDVGCGSGAITRGIAQAVGPAGKVVGIDVSHQLVARAVANGTNQDNLSYEIADIMRLDVRDRFDVVTAARVLQWLAEPRAALEAMAAALKTGGHIVVLDYNHAKARWEPEPPATFRRFYAAFLSWRADAGMDNEIGDHLATMLTDLGLVQVDTTETLERTRRGESDFERRIALWGRVIETRGHQIVADGTLSETERAEAEDDFNEWASTAALTQALHLVTVSARKAVSTP